MVRVRSRRARLHPGARFTPTEARDRAQAELENLGVLPGRADRHESWQRFARETS